MPLKGQISAAINKLLEFLVHDLKESHIQHIASVVTSNHWTWADLHDPLTGEVPDPRDVAHLDQQLVALTADDSSDEVKSVCQHFIENRRLLCLASFDADIRVDESGRIFVGTIIVQGEPQWVYSGPALPGVVSKLGRGTYEIYFDRRFDGIQIVYSVVLEGDCVACGALNSELPFDHAKFAARRPSLATASALSGRLHSALRDEFQGHPLVTHYVSQIEGATRKVYFRYCSSMMKLTGNSKLVGANLLDFADDIAFLEDFAEMSLMNGGYLKRPRMEEIYADRRPGKGSFYEKLVRWKEQHGFSLHEERGDLIFFVL